jgi:aspartyl aminopeptidase
VAADAAGRADHMPIAKDLCSYIDASPTPYHAVAETQRRLEPHGFTKLREGDAWTLAAGDRGFVARDGSLLAFEVGTRSPAEAGFRVVGAHTDSPNLRLKPNAAVDADGYRQLGVEPYGGVLLHSWLDRDLSLAGRVSLVRGGRVETVLIDVGGPILRVPDLAIHLQREIREQGLKLNPQTHMVPVSGLAGSDSLDEILVHAIAVANGLRVDAAEIASHELMAYDTLGACIGGANAEFLFAARLDNLGSCHAATSALAAASRDGATEVTRVIVLYDHEEVGSRSASGAAGPFLATSLERITAALGGGVDASARALSRSLLVSADMAHAVHPNFADRHEPGHKPVVGGGPVVKSNVNLSYASDAPASAAFVACCRRAGFEPQRFVVRSDMPCGSTIGPLTAARVGIRTVDVGSPMLSMHSCRELAGTADVAPMIRALTEFFQGD